MADLSAKGGPRLMMAAIYARKSTDQHGLGDDEKSVGRQIAHARAYAARNGWAVGAE